MFKTFLKTHEISFSSIINMWAYYISKIPFIGKLVPEDIYNISRSKKIFGNIVIALSLFAELIGKFIYIIAVILIPSLIISDNIGLDATAVKFHIFFFLSFISGPFVTNQFTNNITTDFYMINIMRFNPKDYYLSNILFRYVKYFIYLPFPTMILGLSFTESLIISLEFVAFRIITQAFYLATSNSKSGQLSSKIGFILPIILMSFSIAYGGPFIGFVFNSKLLLLNTPFIIIVLFFAIVSLAYIFKYNKYTTLSKSILFKDDINKINTISSESIFSDVKINELKIDTKSLLKDKYEDKYGINYLNYKFVERHKKIILNPIKTRVLVITILFIISIITTIIFPNLHKSINNTILSSTGVLVFVLYSTSLGEKITKAFFFNCDNSLLRYRFYKDPKVIIDNFKCRLKLVMFFNLIPSIYLALSLGIIMLLVNGNIISYIPIFISIISLSCFFSIHYLFLYYITQPYTSQFTIKSPIYKCASFAIWVAAYGSLQIKTTFSLFTFAIIGLTVIYAIISLALVYKYAPKTFRLK